MFSDSGCLNFDIAHFVEGLGVLKTQHSAIYFTLRDFLYWPMDLLNKASLLLLMGPFLPSLFAMVSGFYLWLSRIFFPCLIALMENQLTYMMMMMEVFRG